MATIKDVALAAGVTPTTVSRVLNNKAHISEKTRRKVFDAMKALNYQPNELARSLFKRTSNLIGVIVPDIKHPFFAELVGWIEYHAFEAGFKVLLCNSYKDSDKEKSYIDMLRRHQVAGIISGSHSLKLHEYFGLNLPLVAIDRYLSDNIPYIASDNYAGGRMASMHLIERGCRKIAHVGGPSVLNTPANKRGQAFVDTAVEKGVAYVLSETNLNVFDDEGYEKVIFDMFARHPDIDGFFASDMICATVLRLADRIGKRIPETLKVVGYDDVQFAALMRPPLTTIRQPIPEIGHQAVDSLVKQIAGESPLHEIILPVQLIERQST